MSQPKSIPKRTDRTECVEVFADGAHLALHDGMLRMEFCVARADSEGNPIFVPVSRVVMQKASGGRLINGLKQLLSGGSSEATVSTVTRH